MSPNTFDSLELCALLFVPVGRRSRHSQKDGSGRVSLGASSLPPTTRAFLSISDDLLKASSECSLSTDVFTL